MLFAATRQKAGVRCQVLASRTCSGSSGKDITAVMALTMAFFVNCFL